jgi:hypothetical protein
MPRLLNRWKLLQLLFLTRRKAVQRIDLIRESLCCHDGVSPRPRQTSRSGRGIGNYRLHDNTGWYDKLG